MLARPGQHLRDPRQGVARRSGLVMDWATASACTATLAACSCCPAPASASATRARASACLPGLVMDRATSSACLVPPRPGQRLRDPCQGVRLPARVGDGPGGGLGLAGTPPPPASTPAIRARTPACQPEPVMDRAAASACPATLAACSCCAAPASTPATRARASACRSGLVMDRATASACTATLAACSSCPAPASAPATRARASACSPAW